MNEIAKNTVNTDYHVPSAMKNEINKLAGAQKKSAKVMQARMFKLGALLSVVKDTHFNGDTKAFGAWLLINCPNIHQNYIAFYIAMFKDESKITGMLQDPEHEHKTSAQSIVRAYRDTLKPVSEPADEGAGSKGEGADEGKGADEGADEKAPSGGITLDGLTLDALMDLADAVDSRIGIYKNAQEYTSAQKHRISKRADALKALIA